jgi:hypothetical protein
VSNKVNVIWKKGDDVMPANAQHVVDAARSDLVLKTLQLPEDVIHIIEYNSDKNSQTIPEYISSVLLQQLRTA